MGIGAAIIGGALISGGASAIGASRAGSAAESAASTSAQAQMEQLAYLKEREAVPQAYREQAIQQLGALYGMPGLPAPTQVDPATGQPYSPVSGAVSTGAIPPSQPAPNLRIGQTMDSYYESMGMAGADQPMSMAQPSGAIVPDEVIPPGGYTPQSRAEFISGLRQDPFYEEMVRSGEEAVLRGASATGGLRSGTASANLARINQGVLRGIYGERVAGLQGLAGLPSNVTQIGQTMANIGQTQAQGQVASGQAWQQGLQSIGNIAGGAIGNYGMMKGMGII